MCDARFRGRVLSAANEGCNELFMGSICWNKRDWNDRLNLWLLVGAAEQADPDPNMDSFMKMDLIYAHLWLKIKKTLWS